MREKNKHTQKNLTYQLVVAIVFHKKTVLFSKSIISDDSQQAHYIHCGLHGDYILFPVSKNPWIVKSFKNMHGYFHPFISNRAKKHEAFKKCEAFYYTVIKVNILKPM